MSKESRRAARLARESRRVGGAGRPPAEAGTESGASTPAGTARTGGAGGHRAHGGSSTGARAGRRDRVRQYHQPTFLERYRTALVAVVGVAIVAVVIGYLFLGATQAAYACTNIFDPSPTPTVSPGSSTRLGFLEDDMGASHTVSPPQRYLYCPPASGSHFNQPGVLGPITPRVYKPDDKVGPENWVHNLEHGGLVILYRGDSPGASTTGQLAFNDYYNTFPPSPICKVPRGQISPVIARFNDMPHPYAALVWDRVFYLDTWDPALVTQFYLTESERLDADGAMVAPPEKAFCNPSPAPSAGASGPAASGSPAAASPGTSGQPSAAPSASPEPSTAPS